jgi:hypothetical protein
LSNYSADLYITRFALLDLSTVHDTEWCDVLVSQASPVSGTTYAFGSSLALASFYAAVDIIRPDPITGGNVLGIRSGGTTLCQIGATNGADDALIYDSVNSSYLLSANNNAHPAGSTTRLEVVFSDDGKLYVFVDKVLRGSVNIPANWGTPDGIWNYHAAAGEDQANLTVNPYPALGGALGATDRLVCPQANDVQDCPSDFMAIFRNFQVPAAERHYFMRGTSHNVAPYCLGLVTVAGGASALKKYDAGVGVNLFPFSVVISTGQDVMITGDGNNTAAFCDGTARGSSSGASLPTNTGAKMYSQIYMDAAEFWPLYVNLPFKL